MESTAFAGRPIAEWSDEELVALAKRGDAKPPSAFSLGTTTLCRLKANSYFLAGGDGDDLIQEGYIGLFKAIRDYEYGRSTSFRSFAELCVTRQIITAIKTASRQKHVPAQYVHQLQPFPLQRGLRRADVGRCDPFRPHSDPVQQVISSEEVMSLTDCLQRLLSPLESKVLKYYLEGNSYEAIAVFIRHDTKTVDNALQRIKRKVTLHLESRRVLL